MVITTSPLCPCLHSPVTTGSLARSLFLHFSSLKLTPCHTLLPPLSVLHNAMCVIILLYFPSATLSHVIVDLAGPALPVRVRSALFVCLLACEAAQSVSPLCLCEKWKRERAGAPLAPIVSASLLIYPFASEPPSSFPQRSESRRHLRSLRKPGGSDESLSRKSEKRSSRTKKLSVHIESKDHPQPWIISYALRL